MSLMYQKLLTLCVEKAIEQQFYFVSKCRQKAGVRFLKALCIYYFEGLFGAIIYFVLYFCFSYTFLL